MARKKKKQDLKPVVHAMQVRRLCLFAALLLSGFGVLGFRLVDLQVLRHEELSEAARDNTARTYVRQPTRGDIRDRRGNLLATSKIVKTICADPSLVSSNYLTVAQAIAPVLNLPLAEVAEKLQPRTWVNKEGQERPVQYVVLKRKVEEEDWLRVKEAMSALDFGIDEAKAPGKVRAQLGRIRRSAVFDEPDQIRFYPNQSLAAHVLGYVGVENRSTVNGEVQENVGRAGLEFSLNNVLTGIQGWRETEMDSGRREMVTFRNQDVAPRAGLNAVLTIDAGAQHIVEDEIAEAMAKHTPISITAIVVRPKTGEILALANLPTYNPNDLDDNPAARRNRAITDLAEPGSTFKIVVVSGALNDGLIQLHDTFDCENGRFRFGGRYLNDHERYGILTDEKIITKSSNIGSAKIAIRMGEEKLYDYIRDFGFGQRTGIPLPGEVNGILHPVKRWSKISISRIPMGHEVAVTPLQMVMAMSAIANKGVLMKPLLIERFVDQEGREVARFQPQPVRQAVSESAAAKMVTALKSVVATNGTGVKASLDYYTVAGKTGTSQKIVNGRYVRNKHFSSFIGFFPADDPELCISVVLDEPHKGYYGSETAAPIFKRIAERLANYLAIPPEPGLKPPLSVAGLPRPR